VIMRNSRCGTCKNCIELDKVRRSVLSVANPPFSHADQGTVDLWNREVKSLPCMHETRKTKQGVRDLNPPKQKNERRDKRTAHELCVEVRNHPYISKCYICGFRQNWPEI